MNAEARQLFEQGLVALNLSLTSAQQSQFEQLLTLLQEGNARFNLTALRSETDIVLKHFLDSLTCLRGGHLDGPWSVVDLGTGAGFPSLPLAIVRPELRLTPLDSTRKKIDFVRETAQALGLENVQPLVGRAETLGQQPEHRAQYDRVVARAVAALPVLAELALPLLKIGGQLVAQKGPLSEDELAAGRRAAQEVGGQIQEVDAFSLPLTEDRRSLIVIEKVAATPKAYPRRDGVPGAQPLFWKTK